MNKHTNHETFLDEIGAPSAYAPRHAATHYSLNGVDHLVVGTLVQVISNEGADLDMAQIIHECGCGCGQYSIGPVNWVEDLVFVRQQSMLQLRVIDTGVDTAEGVPMVEFRGIKDMRPKPETD